MKRVTGITLKIVIVVAILIGLAGMSGCATPLGQQYGTIGAAGGALLGGALGGWEGAAAGAAAGGMAGGAYGDHEYREQERSFRNQPRFENHQGGPSGNWNGYVRPCRRVYQPIYDRFGNVVGQRPVCQ
ncbi:MAG: hypothetical protein KC652_21145 [Cyanobacteria bacterium HKST-UBA01]|nr:hypothetical protein [Cyanobacteria bacterium HKST-UBA01]